VAAAERDEDGGDLGLFWQGGKPKYSDARGFRTYHAAREHVNKVRYARKAAIRAAGKGDPAAWTRFEQQRGEIVAAFAAKKVRIDEDCDAIEAKAAARRAKTEAAAGPRLEAEARRYGLILDIDRDTVGARGQGSGRFSGSTVRMEAIGQITQRLTAERLVDVGVLGPGGKKRHSSRALFLVVLGDAFELLVKLDSDDEGGAPDFMARYNTAAAKAALAHGGNQIGAGPAAGASGAGIAERLALLANLHASGALSDGEFATAKAQLLGSPQDAPPPHWQP
jgi:hypothetical protein